MMLADVRAAVDRTHTAFLDWRRDSFKGRATLMRKAGRLLRARDLEYARLMAVGMGKPVRAGIAEIHKCALAWEFYAENAQTFLALEPVDSEYRKTFIAFQPLGVILGIMPWNFPFWQAFRFLAPTLMAGNGACSNTHRMCLAAFRP
jgi:succinate-semialdehyde dehydrogenase / glutarate-semialdehyde dehydrogenase